MRNPNQNPNQNLNLNPNPNQTSNLNSNQDPPATGRITLTEKAFNKYINHHLKHHKALVKFLFNDTLVPYITLSSKEEGVDKTIPFIEFLENSTKLSKIFNFFSDDRITFFHHLLKNSKIFGTDSVKRIFSMLQETGLNIWKKMDILGLTVYRKPPASDLISLLISHPDKEPIRKWLEEIFDFLEHAEEKKDGVLLQTFDFLRAAEKGCLSVLDTIITQGDSELNKIWTKAIFKHVASESDINDIISLLNRKVRLLVNKQNVDFTMLSYLARYHDSETNRMLLEGFFNYIKQAKDSITLNKFMKLLLDVDVMGVSILRTLIGQHDFVANQIWLTSLADHTISALPLDFDVLLSLLKTFSWTIGKMHDYLAFYTILNRKVNSRVYSIPYYNVLNKKIKYSIKYSPLSKTDHDEIILNGAVFFQKTVFFEKDEMSSSWHVHFRGRNNQYCHLELSAYSMKECIENLKAFGESKDKDTDKYDIKDSDDIRKCFYMADSFCVTTPFEEKLKNFINTLLEKFDHELKDPDKLNKNRQKILETLTILSSRGFSYKKASECILNHFPDKKGDFLFLYNALSNGCWDCIPDFSRKISDIVVPLDNLEILFEEMEFSLSTDFYHANDSCEKNQEELVNIEENTPIVAASEDATEQNEESEAPTKERQDEHAIKIYDAFDNLCKEHSKRFQPDMLERIFFILGREFVYLYSSQYLQEMAEYAKLCFEKISLSGAVKLTAEECHEILIFYVSLALGQDDSEKNLKSIIQENTGIISLFYKKASSVCSDEISMLFEPEPELPKNNEDYIKRLEQETEKQKKKIQLLEQENKEQKKKIQRLEQVNTEQGEENQQLQKFAGILAGVVEKHEGEEYLKFLELGLQTKKFKAEAISLKIDNNNNNNNNKNNNASQNFFQSLSNRNNEKNKKNSGNSGGKLSPSI